MLRYVVVERLLAMGYWYKNHESRTFRFTGALDQPTQLMDGGLRNRQTEPCSFGTA